MDKIIETVVISKELIDAYSPVPLNMNEKKLYPFILEAQNELKTIIGKEVINDLCDKIERKDLNKYDEALLLKIAPYLACYTCYLALPSAAFQFQQKGITKEMSENSSSATLEELSWLRQDLKNQADRNAEILLEYLCECKELYPLFTGKCSCGENRVVESKLIYIPRRKNKCCNG